MTRTITLNEYRAALKKPAKRSKYGNVKVQMGDLTFDSKAEYKRWQFLELQQLAGDIRGLKHHTRYQLIVSGMLVATYEDDASYLKVYDAKWKSVHRVVEDTKGTLTRDCAIKLKLMKACHGIDVRLITKATHPEVFR